MMTCDVLQGVLHVLRMAQWQALSSLKGSSSDVKLVACTPEVSSVLSRETLRHSFPWG